MPHILFLGVISRLVPHAANFTAVGGLAIFSSKKFGVLKSLSILLLTMLITDIFLGFSFASIFVYIGMLGYIFFAKFIKSKISYLYIPVISSLFFFLISNFGVWLGPWYSHDLTGLIRCYTLALPFLQNTVVSDVVITIASFSVYAIFNKSKQGVSIWQKSFQNPLLKRK